MPQRGCRRMTKQTYASLRQLDYPGFWLCWLLALAMIVEAQLLSRPMSRDFAAACAGAVARWLV